MQDQWTKTKYQIHTNAWYVTLTTHQLKIHTWVCSTLLYPELQHLEMIEWEFNVAETLGDYDMIIGRDMLSELGINLRFSDNVVEWNGQELDFHPDDLEDDIYAVANIPDPISVTFSGNHD